MNNNYPVLRALLWFICVYHVCLGIAANLPPDQVRATAAAVFGVQLPDNPALFQLLKPFGAYGFVFGVMMGVAAWNPIKNRALISIGVVLFAVRLLQRLVNLENTQQYLGVTEARNWATIVTVSVFAGLLAVLRWKLYRDMRATEPAAAG